MRTDEEIRETIRTRLKQLRLENNKTQSDVAKHVGKSDNAIGSWEQGLSLPDIETLYRLSLYYGKTLDYMYGIDENEEDSKDGR